MITDPDYLIKNVQRITGVDKVMCRFESGHNGIKCQFDWAKDSVNHHFNYRLTEDEAMNDGFFALSHIYTDILTKLAVYVSGNNTKEEKFPPLPMEVLTNSEKYGKVFTIENEKEAQAFYNMCVTYTVNMFSTTDEYAMNLEKLNIAFYIWFMSTHGTCTQSEMEKVFHIADMIGCKKQLINVWSP